jgi:hypothetical protein
MRQKKPKPRSLRRLAAMTAGAATVLAGTALAGTAVSSAATAQPGQAGWGHNRGVKHVLLISVDGMHQSDLD